jgi:hypothetical protein
MEQEGWITSEMGHLRYEPPAAGIAGGRWCLDPNEDLSPGQAEEIDRVVGAYPHLTDDDFVKEHVDEWLR